MRDHNQWPVTGAWVKNRAHKEFLSFCLRVEKLGSSLTLVSMASWVGLGQFLHLKTLSDLIDK